LDRPAVRSRDLNLPQFWVTVWRRQTCDLDRKVTLEDVEPEVMRRLDVPLKIRLDRHHHVVLQVATGWTDSHLYQYHKTLRNPEELL
jgi:hypothetical protein